MPILRDSFSLFIGFFTDFRDTFLWIFDSRGDEIFFCNLGRLGSLGIPLFDPDLGVFTFP